MVDLIERLARWKADDGDRSEHTEDDRRAEEEDDAEDDMWDFGTIKTIRNSCTGETAGGTFARHRGTAFGVAAAEDETFLTPNTTPQKTLPGPLLEAGMHGSTRSSGSSGGSSGGGTVRQGLLVRPALAGPASNASSTIFEGPNCQIHSPARFDVSAVAARDYGDLLAQKTSTSTLYDDQSNSRKSAHDRYVSAAGADGTTANGQPAGISTARSDASSSDDAQSDHMEESTSTLREMRIEGKGCINAPQNGISGEAHPRVKPVREPRAAHDDEVRDAKAAEGAAEDGPHTALDTLLLPVLEQLSVAVSQHHQRRNGYGQHSSRVDDADEGDNAAQLSIRRLCAAFVDCERTTKGFSNAFAIEVFHAMNGDAEDDLAEMPRNDADVVE